MKNRKMVVLWRKKNNMYQLLRKSEKEFENDDILDAKIEIESLREKYQVYVKNNVKKGIEDAEAGRVVPHNEVKDMFCK